MSDPLAVAVWRAKAARQTPRVINVIDFNEEELKAARSRILELEESNAKLRGRVGGLVTELRKRPFKVIEENPTFLRISRVAEVVSSEFRMAVIDMQSERRTRDATQARMVAIYLCRKLTNRSYPTIAKFFGGRDHTTAMHAFKTIEARIKTDLVLRGRVEKIENILLGSGGPPSESSAPAASAVGATIPGDA